MGQMCGQRPDVYYDRVSVAQITRRQVANRYPSVGVIIRTGVSKLVSPHVYDWRITNARVIRVRIVNETWIAIKVRYDSFRDSRVVSRVDAG